MDSLYYKTVDTINLTLRNVTSRIDNVENLDYKFWIPTGIALFSVLYTLYQNFVKSKQDTLINVESKIDSARLELTTKTISVSSENLDKISKIKVIDAYLENLLNKYDDGCKKYMQYKIFRKEFKQKYHTSIVDIVKEYKDKFGTTTEYINLLNYYNKEHNNH